MYRDRFVVAIHRLSVKYPEFAFPTDISAGSSVASGPMNSSDRSRTGFALEAASNLSAL